MRQISCTNCKWFTASLAAIALLAALGAKSLPGFSAVSVSWQALSKPGQAIVLRRNSHATATAWLVRYYGLDKSNETDKKLVATCWVYTQRCECGHKDKPTLWEIGPGLKKLCQARHYPHTRIEERCRYAGKAQEQAGWDDYVAAIKDNRPVILTFCYAPEARQALAEAQRRVAQCFSAVGIGYLHYGDRKLLICHDGLTTPADSPASIDRVSALELGINTKSKPWGQAGTGLYKWEGDYTNLVMVFMGRPEK